MFLEIILFMNIFFVMLMTNLILSTDVSLSYFFNRDLFYLPSYCLLKVLRVELCKSGDINTKIMCLNIFVNVK